ncbi:LuxR C-terminal-related transcriptional regulator [Kitasatospora kifunensis]|uniref:DNA-binding NarL/FixJ family response regulator n=1 Tax=Kitasatospora kifunensis TaxID=58351 RepID=A0A7W7R3E7_KITKI|nr:response regulator transcription factor [Kitasatospora kifunensis]MBB4924621.1 DNA-binding NarL/FixJ family response regulator [Kitasatospora kifunensis]
MERTDQNVATRPVQRAVVVDPWPLLRDAVAGLLTDAEAARVVGTARSDAEGWELCRTLGPDLVITDADLLAPGDGIRLGRRLRSLARPPQVLVYSGSNEPSVVVECLGGAADCFVHRSAEPELLVSAVRGLAGGRPVWFVGEQGRDAPARGDLVDGALLRAMTSREQEVLGLLLRRYSNEEIAGELCLARQTVKNYVSSVLQKLELSSRRELYSQVPARAA